uniref:Uncharacterized protein n=1 Tax=Siphoviridae sp. cti6f5 TaxID=2826430 RepID=A0A8S5MCW0_9CAUD|nr:MAG TPA: hypothetical protein [Siphoviridae sp. cti6f5]
MLKYKYPFNLQKQRIKTLTTPSLLVGVFFLCNFLKSFKIHIDYISIKRYTINISWQRNRKEKKMEGMTDKQFTEYKETLLKFVLEKLENSKTLEEAKEKIEALIKD